MCAAPSGPQRILFVCTANRIRSAFAAAATTQLRLQPPWATAVPVTSAGVLAGSGEPAMPRALTAARALGVDLRAHRSQALTPALVDGAWLLGMTAEHLGATAGVWRAELLGHYGGLGPIADPVGQSIDAHRTTFRAMLAALHAWRDAPAP